MSSQFAETGPRTMTRADDPLPPRTEQRIRPCRWSSERGFVVVGETGLFVCTLVYYHCFFYRLMSSRIERRSTVGVIAARRSRAEFKREI